MAGKTFHSRIQVVDNARGCSFLRMGSFVSQIGSAVTWTGLPFLLANETGNQNHFGALFFISSVAAIVFRLVGGEILQKLSFRVTAYSASFLSAVVTLVMSMTVQYYSIYMFYVATLILSIIGEIGGLAYEQWYLGLSQKSGLERGIGRLGMFLSVAKLIGMGVGPLIFGLLGQRALMVDAVSFLVASSFFFFVSDVERMRASERKRRTVTELLRSFSFSSQTFLLLFSAAIGGGITFPFITICLKKISTFFSGDASKISLFWFLGSVSLFVSNFLFSKFVREDNRQNLFSVAAVINGISVAVVFAVGGVDVVWPSVVLFCLTNPIVNNVLTAELYRSSSEHERPRVFAAKGSAEGVLTVVGMLAVSAPTVLTYNFVLPAAFVVASLLRVILPSIARKMFIQNSACNIPTQ